MADPSDTTPLVDPSAAAPAADRSSTAIAVARSQPLKWYNYVVLLLLAVSLLGGLLSSFASLWKLLFVPFTLLLLLKLYHDHVIAKLKPSYDTLPLSSWITHIGFAYFLGPLFLVVLVALLFFALGITFFVILMLAHAVLSALYPDAMAALASDLMSSSASVTGGQTPSAQWYAVLSTRSNDVVGAVKSWVMENAASSGRMEEMVVKVKDSVTGLPCLIAAKVSLPSHAARAVWGHVQHNYFTQGHHHHQQASTTPKIDFDTNAFQDAAAKTWRDMIDAGANPGVLVAVIVFLLIVMFLLFVVVGGIGVNALLEVVKFKLFKRHKLLPNATALRVKGLGFYAITGAFFLALSAVISTSYGIVPTFLNCLIFAITSLTDVAVLVLSQLLVVAAFAEAFVLQSAEYGALKKAWKTSVLFNFFLALLRVGPAAKADMRGVVVDGRQVTESDVVPSLIALVVFGGARIALLHKFGMPFAARFRAAVEADAEEETSQA